MPRHLLLAAEQVRGAGKVEEQPVGARQRRDRRPAPRGEDRQALQRGEIALGIGGADVEPRHLRARLGDGHAGPQPQCLGGGAGGGDLDPAAAADGRDEGGV